MRSLSHFASFPITAKAINSVSMVECDIQVCFLDPQETAPPPSVNTQLVVDKLSPTLDIQLESEYPSCIAGNFEYWRLGPLVFFR